MTRFLIRLMNAPSAARKIAAAGFLSFFCLCAGGTVYAGYTVLATKYNDIQSQRRQAGQLLRVAALGDAAPADKPGSTVEQSDFLDGESENIILAELQSRLMATAEGHGAKVTSVGNAPKLTEDGISYLGLRTQLSGRLSSVHKTLFELETGKPVLFIEDLNLASQQNRDNSEQDKPVELSAQFLIYGAISVNSGPDE